jgi:hypothetical protein
VGCGEEVREIPSDYRGFRTPQDAQMRQREDLHEKDTMVSNIFSRDSYRQQVQAEIAHEAGIAVDAVKIDVPTLPSVPYHHSAVMEHMEIPVFSRTQAGERTLHRLSEISKIFETLKGFINILRVYTDAENRERVEKATSKVLGKIPVTAKISY